MPTPIFDRSGNVIGWLDREIIRDMNGQHRAFVTEDRVYNYGGRFLGRIHNGFFRDSNGNAIAFIKGAGGGPLLPIPSIPPIPPVFPVSPVKPVPSVPPVSPIPSLYWSNANWDSFLGGS